MRTARATIRRRVTPTGGNGVFEYAKPDWSTDGVIGRASFDSRPIAVGESAQRTPGRYELRTHPVNVDGVTIRPQSFTPELTAGTTVSKQPSAVRVRFDKPVTLGSVNYFNHAFSLDDGSWKSKPEGVTVFVLPLAGARSSSTASADSDDDFTVLEGELKEIVLPTSEPPCAPEAPERSASRARGRAAEGPIGHIGHRERRSRRDVGC